MKNNQLAITASLIFFLILIIAKILGIIDITTASIISFIISLMIFNTLLKSKKSDAHFHFEQKL